MPDWIITFFAVVIGSISTLVGTWLSNSAALKREKSSREETAKHELALKNAELQREKFIALQEALLNVGRLTNLANYEDVVALIEGKAWKDNVISEPLNTDLASARRRLAMLASRVHSDGLRSELEDFVQLSADVTIAQSQTSARNALDELSEMTVRLNNEIGGRLRAVRLD